MSVRNIWPRLVLIGDSLTQQCFSYEGGWGAMLADSLTRRCDVVARGFSGYNSRQWVTVSQELPASCLTGQVALVWLGANDASSPGNPQQYVPVQEYGANLGFIVACLKDRCGVPDVLLLTPPPADEDAMCQEWRNLGRCFAETSKYADECRKVASSLGIQLIDVYAVMLEQSNWRSLLRDGLHLSRSGAELVHRIVLSALTGAGGALHHHFPSGVGCGEQTDVLILPGFRSTTNGIPCSEVVEWLKKATCR